MKLFTAMLHSDFSARMVRDLPGSTGSFIESPSRGSLHGRVFAPFPYRHNICQGIEKR